MPRFYLTHTDTHGERHQLPGAWEANTAEDAIARMLIEAMEEDDGMWSAHIITSDRDVI